MRVRGTGQMLRTLSRVALTWIIAFDVWWNFLAGDLLTAIKGLF